MFVFAAWSVQQRERRLRLEAERETNAYAVALGLAIDAASRGSQPTDVQQVIDRISLEPTIYGVLVYDESGRLRYLSDPLQATEPAPPAVLQGVIATGEPAQLEREIEAERVYSVIRPIEDRAGEVLGAYEVAQSLANVEVEIARTRTRFFLNTLTLVAAVTVAILVLVRQLIARPLARFVAGARALGRGELGYRIGDGVNSSELRELATAFNRMAGQLEVARVHILDEAEERIGLERRLRETEKLAAIGNLAAGVAHEIAAPLHVIRGRAELLLRRESLPDPQRRNLSIIIEQIDRITFIVRNLLDFARRREPRVERFDLGSVVAGVTEFIEPEFARRDIDFTVDVPGPLHIMGDPQLLHQVLLNLLVNAMQALEPAGGGRVVVNAREEAADAGSTIVVSVDDDGPGIAQDVLPNIFDPFFTTKSGQGTGLGLAIARSIVLEHGGSIEAGNHPANDPRFAGRGASFRVVLPVSPAPEAVHA
jgi:signal transduction histidine kinase